MKVIIIAFIVFLCSIVSSQNSSYRAAVVEYAPFFSLNVVSKEEAQQIMLKNLDYYEVSSTY